MNRLLASISGIAFVLYGALGAAAVSPPPDEDSANRIGVEYAEPAETYPDADDSAPGESGCPVLVSSEPPCSEFPLGPGDIPLSHSRGNCVVIQFSGPITAPVPGAEIQVRELLDDGALGTDVTGYFDFEVVGAGDELRVRNRTFGPQLLNQTWYGVRAIGGCFDFDLQFPVLYGDADGNREVNALDLNVIWRNRGVAPPCSRLDINGDGVINAFEMGGTWRYRGLTLPEKPSGHTCDPPP